MYLSPYEFEKAKEGDIFVKKNGKLVAVSFAELSKELKTQCDDVLNYKQETKANSKSIDKISTQLETLVKSHFITVFSLFELKALKGEIEVDDEELLNLDEKVLSGECSVDYALEQHEYLKETYNKLFGKVGK